MQRILSAILCAVFLGIGTASHADDDHVDRFWALILKADAEDLGAALDDLDQRVKAGEVSYGSQRAVYSLFMTTHPDVGSFLSDWYASNPNSRHAMAAEMWRLYHLAWIYRGNRFVSQTHPAAFERFHAVLGEAHQIAETLFDAHPDFVPGTDGVLVMMRGLGGKHNARAYLSRIFEHTPNKGSIRRATVAFYPQWGGDASDIYGICNQFAGRTPPREAYDKDLCIVEELVVSRQVTPLQRMYVNGILNRRWDEMAPRTQMYDAIYDRPDAEKVRKVLKTRPLGMIDHIEAIARVLKDQSIIEPERARAMAVLRRNLDRDPMNPSLLTEWIAHLQFQRTDIEVEKSAEILRQEAEAQEETGAALAPEVFTEIVEKYEAKYRPQLEPLEAEIGLLASRLSAFGELDPDVWSLRAKYWREMGALYEDPMGERLRALENAIIYSRYRAPTLEQYYFDMATSYRALNSMRDAGQTTSDWFGGEPDKVLDQIACPYVRSMRLLEAVCLMPDGSRGEGCWHGVSVYEKLAQELEEAAAAGVCPAFVAAPIKELVFERARF